VWHPIYCQKLIDHAVKKGNKIIAYTPGIFGKFRGGVTLDIRVHNSGLQMLLDVVMDVVGDEDHDRVLPVHE